jgi:hypothetical protein
MASLREYQRRSIIPLAGLGLAAYYLFFLVPLDRRSKSLDEPLQTNWLELAASLEQTNTTAIDFRHVTNQLTETRQALLLLQGAKQQATARIELGAALRAKMNAPFQLVDYENQRSKQADDLGKLAKQQQVSLEATVLSGFPEHTADIQQPALLWAALSLVNDLLTLALQCKVSTIHTLEVPVALTNAPSANDFGRLAEIPLQVEFTGSAASVAKVLQFLPLRAEEIQAAGLQVPADKPAVFIDRLIIKKQSPDKPDEVRVFLRAIGFVLRE